MNSHTVKLPYKYLNFYIALKITRTLQKKRMGRKTWQMGVKYEILNSRHDLADARIYVQQL